MVLTGMKPRATPSRTFTMASEVPYRVPDPRIVVLLYRLSATVSS